MIPLSAGDKALLLDVLVERKAPPALRAFVAAIKADRSCATCALQSAHLCHGFGAQRIPDDFFDVGCDSYLDRREVPF